MNLSALIEDYERLEKEGWKRDSERNYSGVQGFTTKWQKEHSSGAKSTVFNKTQRSDIDSPFGINTILSTLFNEMAARKIINMINVAGKAYGYGASLYPIPKMNEYTIKYVPDAKSLEVHFVNSSFNNETTGHRGTSQQRLLVSDYIEKLYIFNIMLGNGDAHTGNFAVNSKKKRIYAIDLGMAFATPYSKDEISFSLNAIKNKIRGGSRKTVEQEKKIAANFINFLDMFIEHNYQHMVGAIDDTAKEISKSIAKAVLEKKPSEKIEQVALDAIGMFQTTVKDKKKKLKNNVGVVKNFIKSVKGLLK
jgi:hypothetical protein